MFQLEATSYPAYSHVPLIQLGEGANCTITRNGEPYVRINFPLNDNAPFDSCIFFEDTFCVGNGQTVFCLALETLQVSRFSLPSYFVNFHVHNSILYVLSGFGISAYDRRMTLLWENQNLAIDGVVLHSFTEKFVTVDCEMDPPGGWVRRRLMLESGQEIP